MPNSEKATFIGSQGEELAAMLELPESGEPTAYAMFVHCFTCSKDSVAASRVSRALARLGIATLRFDFTGLGSSAGDFANTNFSSNVADLIRAVDYLREQKGAPSVLIGHSLGAAAVLAAAPQVPGPLPANVVEVAETRTSRFGQVVRVGKHVLTADEPASVTGGTDTGPSPYDYLLTALGACTSMTVRMYADRKEIPLERVAVRLSHQKIHAEDCLSCETEVGKVDHIDRQLEIQGDLTREQRYKLLEIADKCPVHRTLESEVKVETRLEPDQVVARPATA